MIQSIVKIKSTTTLPTKNKKKTYLSVTWVDGEKEYKKPIFDPALQEVFQSAEKSGESVNVGVEKEGDFWNVKTAEITSEAVVTEQKEFRSTWKPSRNDETIMLQVAFKGAVECEGYWYVPDGQAQTARVIQNTEELFVGLQEILKSRTTNPVVEEAKKEYGAVEK